MKPFDPPFFLAAGGGPSILLEGAFAWTKGSHVPKEQLVVVLMTQAQPGPWQREFKELFRQMVYQAIVD